MALLKVQFCNLGGLLPVILKLNRLKYDRFKYDKFLSDRLKICHSGVDDNVNIKFLVPQIWQFIVLNLAI